jgi:hypothetical protein
VCNVRHLAYFQVDNPPFCNLKNRTEFEENGSDCETVKSEGRKAYLSQETGEGAFQWLGFITRPVGGAHQQTERVITWERRPLGLSDPP